MVNSFFFHFGSNKKKDGTKKYGKFINNDDVVGRKLPILMNFDGLIEFISVEQQQK